MRLILSLFEMAPECRKFFSESKTNVIEWLEGGGFYIWLGLLIGRMLGGKIKGLAIFPKSH
jgi:hypothetical protein